MKPFKTWKELKQWVEVVRPVGPVNIHIVGRSKKLMKLSDELRWPERSQV